MTDTDNSGTASTEQMEGERWQQPVILAVHGWRKRCLYGALVLLLCLTVLNIALFTWIVKVLNFDTNGLKYLRTAGDIIELTEKTFIMDTLVATGLYTRNVGCIKSSRGLTLGTTGHGGFRGSNIRMENNVLEVNSPVFRVTDPRGKTLFSADKDTVSLTASTLSIAGEGGAVFQDSLQTPVVSADIRSDLVLESLSKGLEAVTPAGVSIESRAGGILASSHQDIKLITVDGSIKLESANVLLGGLDSPERGRERPRRHHPHSHSHSHPHHIYQLCVSSDGDLFLAHSEATCHSPPQRPL